jgi:UPF0755 protein
MRSEHKFITLKDWLAFVVSTFLIFLSSVLLVISAVIFALFRLARRRPVLLCFLITVLVFLFLTIQWFLLPISWRAQGDAVSILVKQGDSMSGVVQRLNQAKLIKGGKGLLLLSRVVGKDRHIQVGRYDFEKGVTLHRIFTKLTSGDVTLKQVTIPEGRTIKQTAGILQREIQIDSSEFVRIATDGQFTKSMGVQARNLEGYLFPDTYRFSWETTPEKVAQILVEQFRKIYADSLRGRADEIYFTLEQVVTLASMIEAEARDGDEREMISAVYHNRLKRGMLLQCDPTVIYALPELDRPLLLKDLEVDSPYNTYKYPGLPPGPICNPGKASILAALYPAQANYLYFVARGDGTHVFSSTLREHNNAKVKAKQATGSR